MASLKLHDNSVGLCHDPFSRSQESLKNKKEEDISRFECRSTVFAFLVESVPSSFLFLFNLSMNISSSANADHAFQSYRLIGHGPIPPSSLPQPKPAECMC